MGARFFRAAGHRGDAWVAPSVIVFLLFTLVSVEVTHGSPRPATPPSLDSSAPSRFAPRELIIRLRDDRDLRRDHDLAVLNARWGVESAERFLTPRPNAPPLRRPLERTWVIRFRREISLEAARVDYAAVGSVFGVEPNHLYRTFAQEQIIPNDPTYADLWNLPIVQMPRAWAIEKGNPNTVIALVDTGADLNHADLKNRLWVNPGEIPDNGVDDDENGFVDDIHGWDFVEAPTAAGKGDFKTRDNDPTDETGHGTHVAGIAAAEPDNGFGVAGVAWNCRLMIVRAGYAAAGGGTQLQEDDSAAALIYAAENGAAVANMSWGNEVGSLLLQDTVRYADALGTVLVGATGNESTNSVVYPGGFPEVIAVGASDQNDEAAYFTNANSRVDLLAPGIVILSLDLHDGLRTLSGTSMSCPHVAGVVALMRSKRPTLTNAEIRQILKATADPLKAEGRAVGVGRLNAAEALLASDTLVARLRFTEPFAGADKQLEIIGSAGGLNYAGYRLSVGETVTPKEWLPLADVRGANTARWNGLLHHWNTADVREGIYSLRLEVFDREGGIARDQFIVTVDHSPPKITRNEFFYALAGGLELPFLRLESDDYVTGTLTLETPPVNTPLALGIPHWQYLFSLRDLLPPGEWNYTATLRNLVGMETEVSSGFSSRERPPNPYTHTRLEGVRLPALNLARKLADFDGDGLRELIGGTPGESGFLVAQIYEIQADNRLRAILNFRNPFTPLDIADFDGDGLMEVLGERQENLLLMEPPAARGFPTEEIWRGQRLTNGHFADLDGDGRPEIVAQRDAGKVVLLRSGGNNQVEEIVTLENPTEGSNLLAAGIVTEDFNGDGQPEIVVGDSEGEILAFGRQGNGYALRWKTRAPYSRIEAMAAGTFGGKKSLVIAAREVYDPARRGANFSTVAILQWDGRELVPRPGWTARFLGVPDPPSLTVGKMDGSDDSIGIVTRTHAYRLDIAGDALQFTWGDLASSSEAPLVLDITGDGVGEFLFNAQGVLQIVIAQPSPNAETRPFGLTATALDSSSVRLRWERKENAGIVEIYRARRGEALTLIGQASGANETIDATVSPGNAYLYAVGQGNLLSEPTAVLVEEQPRLLGAEWLSGSRVLLKFSIPMDKSALAANLYRAAKVGDAQPGRFPTSALMPTDGTTLILTFGEILSPGVWEVVVHDPAETRSADKMPLDRAQISARFTVTEDADAVTDILELRVYPNPVSPNRNHPARVMFDRLPAGAQVRLYAPDGSQVGEGVADAALRWEWGLLNGEHRPVGSGVYLYRVEWRGALRWGKIAVLR